MRRRITAPAIDESSGTTLPSSAAIPSPSTARMTSADLSSLGTVSIA